MSELEIHQKHESRRRFAFAWLLIPYVLSYIPVGIVVLWMIKFGLLPRTVALAVFHLVYAPLELLGWTLLPRDVIRWIDDVLIGPFVP